MTDSPTQAPVTTLHEQTGLRIWKNPRNGFTVARLHFTADPRKRSPEWIAASKRGMSRAKWEQEFDISYAAQLGEKAFPEILSRREQIVHRQGPYVRGDGEPFWPGDLVMWAGLDYGARNPSAFEVFTVVDGVTWALWELYGPCKNINDFANSILACPYYPQIRYIVHDPTIGHLTQRDSAGNLTTVAQQLVQAGVKKLLPGNNDEVAWLATMSRHWCQEGEPTFRVLENCPMLIDELEGATYVSMSERQLESQNYREALVDRHNHALDATKYFMNSGLARKERRPSPYAAQPLVNAYAWNQSAYSSGRLAQLGLR